MFGHDTDIDYDVASLVALTCPTCRHAPFSASRRRAANASPLHFGGEKRGGKVEELQEGKMGSSGFQIKDSNSNRWRTARRPNKMPVTARAVELTTAAAAGRSRRRPRPGPRPFVRCCARSHFCPRNRECLHFFAAAAAAASVHLRHLLFCVPARRLANTSYTTELRKSIYKSC